MANPTIKFFWKQVMKPENHLWQLGLLYASKQIALQLSSKYKLEPVHILIRADAHDWTFKTGRKKGVRRDKMHITVDIKDAAMLKENKHLTAHGYLEGNKTATNEFPSMFTVDYVRPKRNDEGGPKIERDEYFDDATDTHVNNWNMAELEAFDEPEELSRVRLGDKFITVLSLALAKMGDDVGGKHTEAAVEEGQRMREALEQEGNDLLGTE